MSKKRAEISQIRKTKHVYNEEVIRELAQEREKLRKKRIKKALIGLLAAVLVFAGLLAWYFIERAHQYEALEITAEDENATYAKLVRLDNCIIKYGSDGMVCMDRDLKNKWSYGFSMTDPVLKRGGDYTLVYDKNGTQMVLFTKDGVEGNFTGPGNIILADVSDYGVTSVLTTDTNAGIVNFYDKSGRKLDIEIKNVLAKSSGYPISMAMSPSGTGLVLSLLFADLGSIQSRVSFLNFEAGKDAYDRVVGFYNYDESIFPEVDYLTSDRVVAFGDSEVVFYSLKNEASPEIISEIKYDEQIESVFTGDEKACVITRSAQGGLLLHLYDSDGEEKLNYGFDFAYTRAEISDGYLMLYGGEQMLIIDTAGCVKYCGNAQGLATSMISTGKNSFLQLGQFGTRRVKFD